MATLLPRVQFITLDRPGLGHADQARLACAAGIRWVQLRAKGLDRPEWVRLAAEVVQICRDHGARCVINDAVEVAADAGAAGVHLGAQDASPASARLRLGDRALVGVTLNGPDDLVRLAQGRPDYAGVGPYRATATKPGHAPVHSDASLRALIAAASVPAFAIGGVTAADFSALRALGAHGVAVSAAIAQASDPRQAAAALVGAARACWGSD